MTGTYPRVIVGGNGFLSVRLQAKADYLENVLKRYGCEVVISKITYANNYLRLDGHWIGGKSIQEIEPELKQYRFAYVVNGDEVTFGMSFNTKTL